MRYEQYEDYKNLLRFKQELKEINIRQKITGQPSSENRLKLPMNFICEVEALIEKYNTQIEIQMENL